MKTYKNIDEIKLAHRNAGGFHFSVGAMKGFKSRIGDTVYGGVYFISSEQRTGDVRRYTICCITEECDIVYASEFQEFRSWTQAKRALDKILEAQHAEGHATHL